MKTLAPMLLVLLIATPALSQTEPPPECPEFIVTPTLLEDGENVLSIDVDSGCGPAIHKIEMQFIAPTFFDDFNGALVVEGGTANVWNGADGNDYANFRLFDEVPSSFFRLGILWLTSRDINEPIQLNLSYQYTPGGGGPLGIFYQHRVVNEVVPKLPMLGGAAVAALMASLGATAIFVLRR